MTSQLPSSPTFSPLYYAKNGDRDHFDFGASSPVVDTSGVPAVDTIDNSSSFHSAINPVARRILMESEFDNDIETENGDVSARKLPLGVPAPLEDSEDEEISSSEHDKTTNRRESQHSLPDVEDLKLSVAAAAAAAGGGSLSLFSSSNRRRILYPALLFVMALVIILFFATGTRSPKPATQTQTKQKGAVYDTVDNITSSNNQMDDRLTQLQNYMIKYGITAIEQFRDADSSTINTPQAQAARWLAYEDLQFPILPTHDKDPTTPEGYSLVSRYAMAVFYFTTNGKNWKNSLSFLDPNKATCDWFQIFAPPKGEVGVLCNQSTRQIIGLSMISNNLRGKIPSELSQVTSLEYLESIENSLSGTIPVGWQKLTALRTVVIAFNQLTGTIPSWAPQSWPDMEFLYLSNNDLTGSIPEEFSEFQKLSVLALDDNILTGKTDAIWNSMRSLEYLYLEDNDFTGTLPNLVAESNSALVILDISSNRFTGSLPDDIFELNRLEVLDLHDNRFDSSIPKDIPEDNHSLKFLALHKNILVGTIPSAISNLKRLSHLDLTRNSLTGTIPNELERLSSTLTYLFLGSNDYQEGPIPSFVYALTNLKELSLKSSKRKGTISGIIGMLDSMLVLDLDDNHLTGSIPNEVGMMTDLQYLLLNRNLLTSSVPGAELAKLKDLRFLLLDNNHLFGDLNPICTLDFLTSVYVDCGEISCLEGCCSCCLDGKPCHDSLLISSHDTVWESDYTRQFFDFDSQGETFYSNRDDDYWK